MRKMLFALTIFLSGLPLLAGTGDSLGIGFVDTLLIQQNYSAAHDSVEHILAKNPGEIRALYLRIAIEQTRILDYESYVVENDRFEKAADSTIHLITAQLTRLRGRDSLQCLYYLASLYGGIGVFQAKTGSLFTALKNSMTSVTLLNSIVAADSTFFAAYLGIGLFHYYLNKSFTWLPFIDAKSEKQSIATIEKATAAPFPGDFAAKHSLCWILIDRQYYAKADSIALTVLKDFPGNTLFLRIRTLCALWGKQYNKAVLLGSQLADLTKKRKPGNWSDLVLAYMVLSNGYQAQGKTKEARASADSLLSMRIPPNYREIPHIKKNLKRIQAVVR